MSTPRPSSGVLSGGIVMSKSLRLLAAITAACILTAFTQAQLQTKKAPSYKEKVLHAFNGTSDGWASNSLLRDAKGNLYGTNAAGGYLGGGCDSFFAGCGTVFESSADGKFRIVHTFKYSDGAIPPFGSLIQDASGNLYGTTLDGGNNGKCESGCGVVFKLGPRGKVTTLYNFTNGSDGADPTRGVIMDVAGNLYGVAQNFGEGEVFELTPSGEFHVLHSFNGTDGSEPNGLILDAEGSLYGTTTSGGDIFCSEGGGSGCGAVYKLDKAGTETVLY